MGFISGYASNTISVDKKTKLIWEGCIILPPPMYYMDYDPYSLTLDFYTPPSSFVFLENFTTGESHYDFPTPYGLTFYITEEVGLWRISVATDPRSRNPEIIYERYFIIDNGEIIDVEPSLQEIFGL